MAMTIKDMRDQIRSIIDIDSFDVSNDVLNRIIGQGFDYIVFSEKRWPFYEVATTFTTTDGTKDYSLATIGAGVSQGLREIMSLRTDDHILAYIGRDDADSEYPINAESSGTPWEWSYWNDTVRLYPKPDSSTLTVYTRASRNPDSFGAASSDAAVPDIPDPFHPIMVTYGLWKTYLQQEDPMMAQQYMTQFHMELDNVARRYADSPAPQPMLLNGRRSNRFLSGFGVHRYSSSGGQRW